MSDRDELQARLEDIILDAALISPRTCTDIAHAVSREVIRLGWRPPAPEVTTVEELDALPDFSILRCATGLPLIIGTEEGEEGRRVFYSGSSCEYGSDVVQLPAMVLWMPEGVSDVDAAAS